MHYLYSIVEYQGAPFLAKIVIEEYDVDGKKRAYNARRIKMSTLSRAQHSQLKAAYRGNYASNVDAVSIADLFSLVKTYDKEFSPKPVHKAVLNDDGTPRVFYHGTRTEFDTFDVRKSRVGAYGKGIYFSPSRANAQAYGSAHVMGCYLAMRNPYVVNNWIGLSGEKLAIIKDELGEEGKVTEKNVTSILKKHGYDGVVVQYQGVVTEIVAFSSTQVKSATDNIGTFDRNNPNIKYSTSDDITESASEHAARAVEVFGLTNDLSRAGFVLPSGQMPNLSEYGLPGVQHKRIERVFEDADGEDPVNRFIQEGNVRLNASAPGIELSARIQPTVAQYNVISKLIARSMREKGVFYVDVVDSRGGIVDSVTYDTRDDAQSILYDLKTYYRRGAFPQNEVRYSASSDITESGAVTESPFDAAVRRMRERDAATDPEAQGMDMVEEVERATQADLEAENKALREDVERLALYLVSRISPHSFPLITFSKRPIFSTASARVALVTR